MNAILKRLHADVVAKAITDGRITDAEVTVNADGTYSLAETTSKELQAILRARQYHHEQRDTTTGKQATPRGRITLVEAEASITVTLCVGDETIDAEIDGIVPGHVIEAARALAKAVNTAVAQSAVKAARKIQAEATAALVAAALAGDTAKLAECSAAVQKAKAGVDEAEALLPHDPPAQK